MKNVLAVVVAALLVSGLATVSFAGTAQSKSKKTHAALEVVDGSVVSVDTANKQIVVLDEKTGQSRAFVVSQKAISSVKAGERVEVKFKDGTSTARSVTVLKQKSNKK